MSDWNDYHNIELVPKKYRRIVEVLLDHETVLSDGYRFYCDYYVNERAAKYYNEDYVLAILVEIAKEIIDKP